MTSNLGSQFMLVPVIGERERKVVLDEVHRFFRPEFLNRLDEIILFHRLGQDHMGPIVDIQIARVGQLLKDRKIVLDLTDAARRWLGRVGYDPVYGARPLKRTLQRRLLDPLALAVLQGTFGEGDTVRADAKDGVLVLNRETDPATVAASQT
jgi:ATP-dependent Clp protease ATP-binding subunit ClpB